MFNQPYLAYFCFQLYITRFRPLNNVVVVYHVTIVAIGHGLLKIFDLFHLSQNLFPSNIFSLEILSNPTKIYFKGKFIPQKLIRGKNVFKDKDFLFIFICHMNSL